MGARRWEADPRSEETHGKVIGRWDSRAFLKSVGRIGGIPST